MQPTFGITDSILLSLFGPPGCGKGTAIKHVIRPYCEKHNIPLVVFPVSMQIGKILDRQSTEVARHVRALQKAGYLVPDDIANEALRNAVADAVKDHNQVPTVFVTDGSPRRTGQIEEALVHTPEALGIKSGNSHLLRFTTLPALCGYRAANRLADEAREDDQEESFKVRWSEYMGATLPALHIIEHNAPNLGVTLKELDGGFIRSSPDLFQRLVFGQAVS